MLQNTLFPRTWYKTFKTMVINVVKKTSSIFTVYGHHNKNNAVDFRADSHAVRLLYNDP